MSAIAPPVADTHRQPLEIEAALAGQVACGLAQRLELGATIDRLTGLALRRALAGTALGVLSTVGYGPISETFEAAAGFY